MTDRDPPLQWFDALIGTWATEATHPAMDEVVPGRVTFEWLEGGHFLIQRSRNDHEMFPDAISVIGVSEAGDGLIMEYFDSRGVRRTYGVALEDGVLRMWCHHAGFSQRFSATLGSDAFEGQWQVAETSGDWLDDLKVIYRRLAPTPLHLFAGLPVRDFQAARRWYRRLLGEPTSFPHATEAVWTACRGRLGVNSLAPLPAVVAGSCPALAWPWECGSLGADVDSRACVGSSRCTQANGMSPPSSGCSMRRPRSRARARGTLTVMGWRR